ncbi:MAG: HAD family phosphatase [Rhizobiaceae bacterium]
MSRIKHVVFDIGKVLVRYDPEVPFRRLIPDDEARAHFFTHVCSPQWNIEQDRGRSWADAEALLIAEHPAQESNIRAFRTHWREMVASEISESVALLRRLITSGVDVTLLTNFASDTFREAQAMYPFLTQTRGVTVSGDVKVLKPDPEIYRIHTETFGLAPSATLFIDDSAANVKGAQEFGWQAVLFTSPAQLKADLNGFALPV